MDMKLYQEVGNWFEAHREAMVADIVRLVRIPSVSDPMAGQGPFGKGCRDCLDEMLAIGREHGFYTENYEYYMGSIGEKEKDWENMIGFWNHLDVVPAGNDWDNPPFEPVCREYFLLGRGAQDNKGPAVGILYMMQCLRELGVRLKHELRLFVGCDEERGMADMDYYTSHYPTPALSMIADSGFPVCFGEKGILEGKMTVESVFSDNILEISGGSASNMIPDRAWVLLRCGEALKRELLEKRTEDIDVEIQEKGIRVTARGRGKHSAFPEGSVNAIHKLCSFLRQISGLEADRDIFTSLAYLSEEYYGANMEMCFEDEISGKTTCAATILNLEKSHAVMHFNIRYAVTDSSQRIAAKLESAAVKHGMMWKTERDSAPNYFPKEHPAVELLTKLYCEITGEEKESFVMGGGTYARKLPNAFAYGVGGLRESETDAELKKNLFRPGHGGAHEPDEGLNIRLLLEAMKIYTMSVIALDDCPLKLPEGLGNSKENNL